MYKEKGYLKEQGWRFFNGFGYVLKKKKGVYTFARGGGQCTFAIVIFLLQILKSSKVIYIILFNKL